MKRLELHYYLEENIHSMDAFVKNKAEAELLKIFKEVADVLSLEISFEIEALKQGGIKEFFKVLQTRESRRKLHIIFAFMGGILSTIISNVIAAKITEDREFEKLRKEEIKLRIEKLKKELEVQEIEEEQQKLIVNEIAILLINSDKIRLHKSNFYATLLNEPKIEKISTTELDESYQPTSTEQIVLRTDFKKFIIDEFVVEPDFIENASIEIVSPVFISNSLKWKGIYDHKPISFNLLDNDFKNAVVNKEISFSSGTYINCTLEIEKTMDEEGNVKITEMNVFDVLKIFEGEHYYITKKAKQIEANKKQLTFNFNDNK